MIVCVPTQTLVMCLSGCVSAGLFTCVSPYHDIFFFSCGGTGTLDPFFFALFLLWSPCACPSPTLFHLRLPRPSSCYFGACARAERVSTGVSLTVCLPVPHRRLTIDDSIECLPLTEEQFEELLGGEQGYGESVSDGSTNYGYDGSTNYPTSLADAVVKLCQADYWEVKPTTTPQPATTPMPTPPSPPTTTPMPTPPSPPLPPSCADETERLRQVFCFGPVYGPPHVPLL